MIQEIYQAIKKKENLRENLTKLKQLLKTPEYRERFVKITGKNYDFLMKLLVEEDPKVRKNAATSNNQVGSGTSSNGLENQNLDIEKLLSNIPGASNVETQQNFISGGQTTGRCFE